MNRTLTAVPGVAVGHADDRDALTGCTAVLGPFVAAADVRGLATGTREMDALSPHHIAGRCDGILLTGGSAFGLAAADGVTRWLAAQGRGFPTRAGRVPIVPAAVIYDLGVGAAEVRPGPEMGWEAAAAATPDAVREGRVGAGTGATVGKLRSPAGIEAGGLGSWAEEYDGGRVSALAVVNAFGDVVDAEGRIVAGSRDEQGRHLDTAATIRTRAPRAGFGAAPGESTTLAVVAVEAPLGRVELHVVARLAMNGIVRRISPSNTPFDGDVVFAVSAAGPGGAASPSDVVALGLRAQECLERAIERAVRTGDGSAASR